MAHRVAAYSTGLVSTVKVRGIAWPASDSQAWPFLIGRTRNHGHRIIVIPEFMTDPVDAAALRDATGIIAQTPDAPILREVQALALGPVSVVYRSFLPRGFQYGLDGDDLLIDDHGRPIRLTEGLILRQPETGVRELGITQADLDRAHAEVTGAYQAFWSQEAAFVRHVSGPFPVSAASKHPGPVISLHGYEPWIVSKGQAPPISDLPPTRLPVGTPSPSGPSAEPAVLPSPFRARRMIKVTAVVLGLVLVVLIAVFGLNPFDDGTPAADPAATKVLTSVCAALKDGTASAAYRQTTGGYQQTASQATFRADLLPGGAPRATTCTYMITASDKSSAQAVLRVASAPTQVTSSRVTVTRQPDQVWLISNLTTSSGT